LSALPTSGTLKETVRNELYDSPNQKLITPHIGARAKQGTALV